MGLKATGFWDFSAAFALILSAQRGSEVTAPRSPGPAAFQDFRSKNGKSGNYREKPRGSPKNHPAAPGPVLPDPRGDGEGRDGGMEGWGAGGSRDEDLGDEELGDEEQRDAGMGIQG